MDSLKNIFPKNIPEIGTINKDVVALTGPILLIKNICPMYPRPVQSVPSRKILYKTLNSWSRSIPPSIKVNGKAIKNPIRREMVAK